jgi:nitrogen-specific signal transduction histidine kinase
MVDSDGHIAFANWEAEAFFGALLRPRRVGRSNRTRD